MILLPLRIYVKSSFGKFNWSRLVIFAILVVLKFDFSIFEQFFKAKIYQNSGFKVSKMANMAIFEIQFC